MTEAERAEAPESLDGARVWLVTDGTADAAGWQGSLLGALRAVGAASVDVLGVSGVLGFTARGLIGQGAEKVARTLRLSRRGEPDTSAFDALERGRPDIVIVDHPGILRTLDIIRDTSRVEAIHVALISGVAGPEQWVGARADAYVCGDRTVLERVARPGLSDIASQLAGPPVPPGFEKPLEREKAREELGLPTAGRVCLVDFAGLTPADIGQLMGQLSLVDGITWLFHYGSDRLTADALREAAALHGVRASMFGHVDDLESFAAAADCVFVGPDAPASAYLAIDIPVVAIGAHANGSGFVASGAIVQTNVTSLAGIARRIAADGVADAHSSAARDAIEDDPTRNVARAIARLWSARAELAAAAVSIRATAAPASESSASARTGRFEEIGDHPPTGESAPLSRQVAKEKLAALIMEERKLEKSIVELAKERDRWFDRLALAEDSRQDDLVTLADGEAKRLVGEIAAANQRIDTIQAQKDSVRRRAASGGSGAAAPTGAFGGSGGPAATNDPADAERRFLQLERDAELDRLRRRTLDDE